MRPIFSVNAVHMRSQDLTCISALKMNVLNFQIWLLEINLKFFLNHKKRNFYVSFVIHGKSEKILLPSDYIYIHVILESHI